jgi:hypothetical protein
VRLLSVVPVVAGSSNAVSIVEHERQLHRVTRRPVSERV